MEALIDDSLDLPEVIPADLSKQAAPVMKKRGSKK